MNPDEVAHAVAHAYHECAWLVETGVWPPCVLAFIRMVPIYGTDHGTLWCLTTTTN